MSGSAELLARSRCYSCRNCKYRAMNPASRRLCRESPRFPLRRSTDMTDTASRPATRGIVYAIAAAALFGASTPFARLLVGRADPILIAALTVAVEYTDAKVRDAAVPGLSRIGPPALSAQDALERATGDKDPTVRSHAAAALKRVRGEPRTGRRCEKSRSRRARSPSAGRNNYNGSRTSQPDKIDCQTVSHRGVSLEILHRRSRRGSGPVRQH